MARELVQKVIDGKTYEFEQFNTTYSLKVLTRLTRLLGESLALGITALGIGDPNQKGKALKERALNQDLLGKAARALVERLDEDEVLDLVKILAGGDSLLCNGRKVLFDEHYQGQTAHLFKVLGAAIEVQYGNFFGDQFASLASARSTSSPDPQA